MNNDSIHQAYIFLIFIINGILIGITFDFFRILRKSFKTSNFITYIEDIIFWIISGLILLYSIFVFNNGELRLFIFIGLFLGIFLYMISISKYIVKISVKVISFIKNIFSKLLLPLKIIFKTIRKVFIKPISFIIISIKLKSNILVQKTSNLFNQNKKTFKK